MEKVSQKTMNKIKELNPKKIKETKKAIYLHFKKDDVRYVIYESKDTKFFYPIGKDKELYFSIKKGKNNIKVTDQFFLAVELDRIFKD